VIDGKIKQILLDRLAEYDNDAKKAFDNLMDNPIWLNKEKGISIKSVTIRAVNNAVALHNGHDFVNTSNNHHVAVFRDAKGDLQEHVVSFYEATLRATKGLPIIDKEYNKELGWQFLFTMKQNEFFVFPNHETSFDPQKVDLLDSKNNALISPNLFRVQKFTTKDYFFRHHQETMLNDNKKLLGITWKRGGLSLLNGIVKVRVNHIGQIVSVGEY
jgi:CRISPR-associated endonuclease Csn1